MDTQEYPLHGFSKLAALQLFLLSAAVLAFEIALTRVFSISQFYHFAFLIVSLALLGFGASGTVLSISPTLGYYPERSLFWCTFGGWISILGAYLAVNWIPFDSFSIAWDLNQIGYFAIQYFCLSIPFFFNGLAVGILLNNYAQIAGRIYAWNLLGAAAGCLFALFTPGLFGGVGTILLIACLAAFATLLPTNNRVNRLPRIFIRVLSITLIIFSLILIFFLPAGSRFTSIIGLRMSPYKSLSYALQYPDAQIISQNWNAFSRIDIVESPGIRSLPGVSLKYFNPPPQELGLFIDGDNLNPIVKPNQELSFSDFMPLSLAFQLKPSANTLILEPRGGLDILIALNQGAQSITAVEANELIVKEAQHIYQSPGVNTQIDTPRSYLRRTDEQYDIVIMSLTDAFHPVRSGAYSLGEDYQYTLESFQDAIAKLTPDGILVVSRWLQLPPSEWLRSFILGASAIESAGSDPALNIIAIRSFNTGLLLLKNSPYSEDELQLSRSFAREFGFDLVYQSDISAGETNRFAVLEEPIYYQNFSSYLASPSRETWIDQYPYDVTPPTDDHPFYGHYFKWSQTRQILDELGKTWQPFGGAGYFIVLFMLGLAVSFAVAIILLPLFLRRNRFSIGQAPALSRKLILYTAGYFGLIGLAFMFVEIPLIQQFILYLGHPAYSLTTILFFILLFSGVGSLISRHSNIRYILGWLVGALGIMLFLLPWIFAQTLEFSLIVRVCITGLVIAPAGIMMGVPLPGGVRMIGGAGVRIIPWVWGVNGAVSVIASILAMLFALTFGFTWVMVLGTLCYAAAWLLVLPLGRWS